MVNMPEQTFWQLQGWQRLLGTMAISAPRPGGNASPQQRPGNNRNNDKESRQQR